MGYVVIVIIAFLLGIAVTAFCFRLRDWQNDRDRQAGGGSRGDRGKKEPQ